MIHRGTGGEADRPLVERIAQASAALCDPSAPADERIKRAAAILGMCGCHIGPEATANASGPSKVGGLAAWQVRRVQTFIEARPGQAVSVADLASIARVSRSHFSRGFRISFGESPYSYLLRLRIDRSLVLLRNTDLPLCLVATECGFSDQAHFNRVFKQRLGGSPGTWRRAHQVPFAAAEQVSAVTNNPPAFTAVGGGGAPGFQRSSGPFSRPQIDPMRLRAIGK